MSGSVSRAPVAVIGVGVAGLLLTALLGIGAAHSAMPSYLAAWLFWSALPIGALPVLMALDLVGRGEAAAALLRPLLLGWPAAAVLALPLLLGAGALYPWAATAEPGFAGQWFTPSLFVVRSCVYLGIWLALSALFAAPRAVGRRRPAAVVGLMLHAVVGTLAATDWAMSVDAPWHSGTYGLLFMTSQVAVAGVAGVLLAARAGLLASVAAEARLLLLIPAAAWAFLTFVQFLIVWSGDLPQEIGYYLSRDAGAGRAAEWLLAGGGLLLPVLAAQSRWPRPLAIAAGLALATHFCEMYWLVTPASRGLFAVTLTDIAAAIGVGGVGVGSALLLARRSAAWRALQVRHV